MDLNEGVVRGVVVDERQKKKGKEKKEPQAQLHA
jgi:hypothetical protein